MVVNYASLAYSFPELVKEIIKQRPYAMLDLGLVSLNLVITFS